MQAAPPALVHLHGWWTTHVHASSKARCITTDVLCHICGPAQGLQYIVANVSDAATLRAMAAQTQVIISTAGPFAKFGTPVVEAALEEGTHYCDITGGRGRAEWRTHGRQPQARA
jgi:short subunit dehydrogenase-like uncharacterized protein